MITRSSDAPPRPNRVLLLADDRGFSNIGCFGAEIRTPNLDDRTRRRHAWLALLLLVPAPSLGVVAGMIVWPGSPPGRIGFALAKLWILALPLVWRLCVERKPVSLSPARRGGFGVGVASGLLISALIAGGYLWLGDRFLDRALFVEKLTETGLGDWRLYVAGAVYWVVVNAVLEEYVWRWFCVAQCARMWRRQVAVVVSAACFTLHHSVALSVYVPPMAVVLCSIGVFLGGLIWSAMYLRYRSIWPGYVSHAIVDVAVFGIGAWLLFGLAA